MTAHRLTDCRIDCDWQGCGQSVFGTHLDIRDATAASTRHILKRHGWKVALPAPGDGGEHRDYCPEHARTYVKG